MLVILVIGLWAVFFALVAIAITLRAVVQQLACIAGRAPVLLPLAPAQLSKSPTFLSAQELKNLKGAAGGTDEIKRKPSPPLTGEINGNFGGEGGRTPLRQDTPINLPRPAKSSAKQGTVCDLDAAEFRKHIKE